MSLTDDDVEKCLELEKTTERRSVDNGLSDVYVTEKEIRRFEDLPPPELVAYLSRFLWSVREKSPSVEKSFSDFELLIALTL